MYWAGIIITILHGYDDKYSLNIYLDYGEIEVFNDYNDEIDL
jgi:hypothetical protein